MDGPIDLGTGSKTVKWTSLKAVALDQLEFIWKATIGHLRLVEVVIVDVKGT